MSSLLLNLPPELRREIWCHLLVVPYRLRQVKECDHGPLFRPLKVIDSTALRVCRKIYDEAFGVLYQRNLFFISSVSLPEVNSAPNAGFQLMKSVDVEFVKGDPTQGLSSLRLTNTYDNWVANIILRFAALCPQLETCTLYFPGLAVGRIAECLKPRSRTTSAISQLPNSGIRERLEIIIDSPIPLRSWSAAQPEAANRFLCSIFPQYTSPLTRPRIRPLGKPQLHTQWKLHPYHRKLNDPVLVSHQSVFRRFGR